MENSYRNKDNKSNNFTLMERIVIIQIVCSLIICGIIYSVCFKDNNLSKGIKEYYNYICKEDMAVVELFDNFKKSIKETFKPINNILKEKDTENINTGEQVICSPVF